MLGDLRKLLGRISSRAGLPAGELPTKAFHHTYCAARLQTLSGRTGMHLPGGARTRPRVRGHGPAGLCPFRHHPAPVRWWSTAWSSTLSDSAIGSNGLACHGCLALGRTLRNRGGQMKKPHDHRSDSGADFRPMGLGRVELPTSRLSGTRLCRARAAWPTGAGHLPRVHVHSKARKRCVRTPRFTR